MKAIKYILVINLILALTSCEKLFKNDELTLQVKDYNGNELRIDGYYYVTDNSDQVTILFLYKNGIIWGGLSHLISDLDKIEEEFRNGEYYNEVKDMELLWGVFNIENNTIKYEFLYSGQGPWQAITREGEILNDTTFHITQAYRTTGGKKISLGERDEVYHFKQFSPKLDSTNSFIP